MHETVCAAYYTAAEENEMLKEQLKEFRTFKDEDTDGVELT